MKKLMKLIQEEVVPLSKRQNIVLMIIIACVFQFVLFYTPALAEEAMESEKINTEDVFTIGNLIKTTQAAEINTDDIPFVGPIETPPLGPENKPADKYRVISTSFHTMTAYNSEVAQTDDTPCITANGFNVCVHGIEDTVAANFLPMGTQIRIPDLFGDRVFVVRDRMNKRYSDRVDIWMIEKPDAMQFGVRRAKIEILAEV